MNPDQIELEAKVAFVERTLDALSEALQNQGQTIVALQRRVAQLELRVMVKGTDPELGPHDSPPPHY